MSQMKSKEDLPEVSHVVPDLGGGSLRYIHLTGVGKLSVKGSFATGSSLAKSSVMDRAELGEESLASKKFFLY